jgi:hypothetical protein
MRLPRHGSRLAAALLLLLAVFVSIVFATTYNTPTIDGSIAIEDDWDEDELFAEDSPSDSRYGEADINKFYVTWDEGNLYFAFTATAPPGPYGNGYILFMDKDAQLDATTGAQDFTNANFYPRRITLSTMGADVMMGGWNFSGFTIKDCVDPENTLDIPADSVASDPGVFHVEASVPWDALFNAGPGKVPAGTKLRFILCSVGGDNSGAYDAAPNSSNDADADGVPDENDSDLYWDQYTDLNQYYEVSVDWDLDGIPDIGYPPEGSISGAVALSNSGDSTTVATIELHDNTTGDLKTWIKTEPGGGAYTFSRVWDGVYDVRASAFSYLDSLHAGVEVIDEADVTGIDFFLREVSGKIIGDVTIADGPGAPITVTAYYTGTTDVAGDGPKTIPPPGGSYLIAAVVDGTFDVYFEADGYNTIVETTIVSDGQTTDIGSDSLRAVRATRLLFSDGAGEELRAVGTTISIPQDTVYFFADVHLELLDDAGNRDLYDLDGVTDSIVISATLMDPFYPPKGDILFADTGGAFLESDTLSPGLFDDGLASFSAAGTEVEVIRLQASRVSLDPDYIQVDILPPEPDFVELVADSSKITAGSPGSMISGQLRDVSGNVVEQADVEVQMLITSGSGKASPAIVYTDPEGSFQATFSSTTAGTTSVTALVGSEGSYLAADTLDFAVRAAKESIVSLSAAYNLDRTATVLASVLDGFGNSVRKEGISIELSIQPEGLIGTIDPETMITDSLGEATSLIEPSATASGIAEISGVSELEVTPAYLFVSRGIAAIDEVAPESDPDHNSLAGADLTLLLGRNDADSLYVIVPFSSDWVDMHMMLLIESKGDPAGASTDPFTFPIYYGHTYLPDFVFTYKYASDDYADLRRWVSGSWEFWDLENAQWITNESVPTKNARPWVSKREDLVIFAIPLSMTGFEGSYGDTIRLQVYISQDFEGSEKRSAYDSTPPDATHDMIPETGEWWETATTPTTLSEYGVYVLQEPRVAPNILDAYADPDSLSAGDDVTFVAEIEDAGGGIGQVMADLSPLGLGQYQTLYDDGTQGDQSSGDGTYTFDTTIPATALGGSYTLYVSAGDSTNLATANSSFGLFIEAPELPDPVRVAADSIGDDHGPNLPGEEGLYYTYPTNQVFFEGSFDLEQIEIYELDDQVVFRVHIVELASPQEYDGAADWNAIYPKEENCTDPARADLNLQKVDIYIDSDPGGAESGLTNRYADIAKCDAWEYAIAVEGWWKGVIHSNGQNTRGGWTLYKLDRDVSICDNYEEDYIDITVAKDILGDPTEEDILNWDLVVCLSGHDGDSNDDNFGAIRWVNPGTAEWQFGGGRTGEDNRERDSNIIDFMGMPGEGKEPGRSQEELMNYESSEARARFEAGKVAVVLEATLCEDSTPPNIAELSEEAGAIPWTTIEGAPVVVGTEISDDLSGISEAVMYWKGFEESSYRAANMGRWYKNFWVGDIDYDVLSEVTNVVDENIYFQAWFAAEDSAGNAIESRKFVIELDEPVGDSRQVIDIQQLADSTIADSIIIAKIPDYFSDGSILELSNRIFKNVAGHINVYVDVDDEDIDLSDLPGGVRFEGVAREFIIWDVGEEPFISSDDFYYDELDPPGFVSLHRPEYLPSLSSGRELLIYRYDSGTERWVLVGGRHRENGNMVRAIMDHAGVYGLFSKDIGIDTDNVLSGIFFSPNPFSPNGDGLYDEVNISFSLAKEADVTLEIYDMGGELVRRLFWQRAFGKTGRISGITWDGKDEDGRVVPYGIYIMRFEVRDNVENRTERTNAAVAVIK